MTNWTGEKKKIAELDGKWGQLATAALSKTAKDADFKAVTALYSSDGTVVWPGFDPGYGHGEIEKRWRTANGPFGGSKLAFNPIRITVIGDIATDFGEVIFNGEGGAHYFVVWRREGGEWKVFSDAWNEGPKPAG
jgi:ketosteroid isomerase-like protein